MKRTLPIAMLLACEVARASEGTCQESILNPDLTFEDYPYFVTELNDPEFVPLGTAVTYTSKKYNSCDQYCFNLAWLNAEELAETWLYDRVKLTTGRVIGWECGGGAACKAPVRAHNVQCTIEVGDCDYFEDSEKSPYTYFKIKRTFNLECLGDEGCKYEGRPITDCCILVSRDP